MTERETETASDNYVLTIIKEERKCRKRRTTLKKAEGEGSSHKLRKNGQIHRQALRDVPGS